jgi:NAD(P)H dehydrogenase (quinone)
MSAIAAQQPHPPRHVVVLGHPDPHSFNHAVAERYCASVRECGQEAVLRDLYALDFDPCLRAGHRPGTQTGSMSADVAHELGLVRDADTVILVYPIWFGMPPAIIKGYVDRVLGAGLTPAAIRDHVPDSILHGKRFGSLSSSATTLPWLDEQGQLASLRQAFDKYLMAAFGMRDAGHIHFDGVVDGLKERFVIEKLYEVEQHARKVCSEIAAERHANHVRQSIAADSD